MSLVQALATLTGVQLTPQALAEERLKVCSTCEHKKIVPVLHKEICGLCGCPLQNKTRVASSKCPAAKW